jgi:uncharacterized protein (TIRG00374 family)
MIKTVARMNREWKKHLTSLIVTAVKISLTIGLLSYVISLVDTNELKPLFSKLIVITLCAAIVVHLLAFFIMSIRWWLILRLTGEPIQYGNIWDAYYLGLFCNNFLPTSMGGDVVRIAKLASNGISGHQLIFSTLLDRIVGLLSIIVMGIIGVNFSNSIRHAIDNQTLFFINCLSALAFIFFLAILNTRFRNFTLNLIMTKIKLWNKLNNFIIYCHDNLESLKNNVVISQAVLLSIVSQVLVVCTYYLIGLSIQVEVSFLEYILVVPVVALVSNLPISLGGLGVRESVLVFLMTGTGVDTISAVSISLLYLAILISVTLPGGILLLTSRWGAERNKYPRSE